MLNLLQARLFKRPVGQVVMFLLLTWFSGCSASYSYKSGRLPEPWGSSRADITAADSSSVGGNSVDTEDVVVGTVAVGDQARVFTIGGDVYDGQVDALSDTLALITDRLKPFRSQVRIPVTEIEAVEIGVPGASAGEKTMALMVLIPAACVVAILVIRNTIGSEYE